MRSWLEPLRRSLADRPNPGRCWFFRDDDAGWDDRRLFALVDVFRSAAVRLDLAAIPTAVSPALGRRLSLLAAEGHVSVHQHGFAHANHEPVGRKSEFGSARSAARQEHDLSHGRHLLEGLLEGEAIAVFTPPWNRCSGLTAALLSELGFAGLSADRTAPRRNVTGLLEVPVAVDWARAFFSGGRAGVAAELGGAVDCAATGANGPAIGVMLHHATMDDDELAALGDLLSELRRDAHGSLTSLSELISDHAPAPATAVSAPGRAPALQTTHKG